jgi:kynurenine formamidase
MSESITRPPSVDVSAEEFSSLFRALCRWGRWGSDDQDGALHFLTPERVAAAAATLVRDGVSVTLSLPLGADAGPANPKPCDHYMTSEGDAAASHGDYFMKDYIGLDYHHDTHTHIDALCHVAYDGELYNNKPADTVTAEGATFGSIEVLRNGLVGRGVLLDIPRLHGAPWLEPGEFVFHDDLEQAERAQGVTIAEGDILLVRTGHVRRLAELGQWNTVEAKTGLHPTAMPLVAERAIAALGSDGNNDTAPSSTEGVGFPIHVLAITALGIHLLDYLNLEDLARKCDEAKRWEFLLVAAPLRITRGTGSPLNPIAIF